MCIEKRFFICRTCGNLVDMIHSSGAKMVCCGKEMEELIPNTVDAAQEKHVPVVVVENNKVTVKIGGVPHPMVEAHYIQWIYLVTKQGSQRRCLKPGQEPTAIFSLAEGDKAIETYEYCNLHGLWKKEI